MVGNAYDESYFQNFEVSSGTTRFWRNLLYGLNGTAATAVKVDSSGNLLTNPISSTWGALTLGYNGSNQLTSITRASDGKVKTFTWTGSVLTGISDWA